VTQVQLAKKIGTTQSVIARLEDAEYTGHSLTMLERIAASCGMALKLPCGEKTQFRPRGRAGLAPRRSAIRSTAGFLCKSLGSN